MTRPHLCFAALAFMSTTACGGPSSSTTAAQSELGSDSTSSEDASRDGGSGSAAHLPLVLLSDAPLPGHANRFDYEDIDKAQGHVILAHMNDGAVVIADLRDGSVLKQLTGIPTARGVVVADDVGTIFVTSSPNQVVLIDNVTLTKKGSVTTGNGPDGDGWDPVHKIVGVSDQHDGALSLITNAGQGTRTQVRLGSETGNVVFDAQRGWFWITVVTSSPPDELVAVDPTSARVQIKIPLPGCGGAHGLRIHPDGKSALIACEDNNKIARVDLGGAHAVSLGATGKGPDVLSIDPGLGWLYVAAESGDLTVFDINKPGVSLVGHDHPGANSHSVVVDPATHRVFFPLMSGPNGKPVLRIMRPSGL